MPLRHSPPLTDDVEAGESKRETITHGVAGQILGSPPDLPDAWDKTQSHHTGTPSEPLDNSADFPPRASVAPTVLAASTADPGLHLSLNSDPVSIEQGKTAQKPGVITVGGIDFHHESEAEFARLLTYYGIEWEYEPNQFPLQWREGRPIEMFRPDFYLTEYDLYIELTTMRQALVRRKNRKLRLLRALYPEISIKLLYRRDYQRLLERFGIRSEEVEAEWPGREPIRASMNKDADEPEAMQVPVG